MSELVTGSGLRDSLEAMGDLTYSEFKMAVQPKKMKIVDPEICERIGGPIIVDEEYTADVYPALSDALDDVESVDVERGVFVFADTIGTEYLLQMLPAEHKREVNVKISQRPLGEEAAQRIRQHMRSLLDCTGERSTVNYSLAELAAAILAAKQSRKARS